MNVAGLFERRKVLKVTAILGGLSTLACRASASHAGERNKDAENSSDNLRMAEVPLSSNAKITIERRGQIVLVGINRPHMYNRIDPETRARLAMAYYQYDH
jgi:enoyl-CoA hydratase